MSKNERADPLPVQFFAQDVRAVARGLLGQILVTQFRGCRTAGRIVEVEAYLGAEDPASHAYRFRRNRLNGALYGKPGDWYVYLSYGVHWCANLVAGPSGLGAAVLLRALEPLEGLPAMRRRRGVDAARQLCAGPGRLCQALGITRPRLDARAMADSAAVITLESAAPPAAILSTPRIGISQAADWPLRFLVRDSPWVSGRRTTAKG